MACCLEALGNGLLPGGIKPFPEPMLICHQNRLVTYYSSEVLLLAIIFDVSQPITLITEISLKITFLASHSNLPGVNGLKVA